MISAVSSELKLGNLGGLILATTVVAVLITGLGGCGQKPVVIKKTPLTISHKFSEDVSESGKYNARTEWFFHCVPTFAYELVSSRQTDTNNYVADIVIKEVHMSISLDVEVVRSQSSGPAVLEHENGHVQICKNVYADADRIAERAARSLIGKKLTGSGDNLKAAQEAATEQALESVCRAYRLSTVEVVNAVSSNYDLLSMDKNELPTDLRIKQAFSRYEHPK